MVEPAEAAWLGQHLGSTTKQLLWYDHSDHLLALDRQRRTGHSRGLRLTSPEPPRPLPQRTLHRGCDHMQESFVLTFTGADRVGIVESLTGLVFDRGGNVETSRMARLGGEFAVLMLVSLPPEHVDSLKSDLETLASQGHKVTLTPTQPSSALSHPQGTTYHIEVEGADHEGIVHSVSRYLSERGINIESLDTEVSLAPMSGTTALLNVRPRRRSPRPGRYRLDHPPDRRSATR